MTQEERELRDSRNKRKLAFDKIYRQYSKEISKIQKDNIVKKEDDFQMNRVKDFIELVNKLYRSQFKDLVKCTHEKYLTLLQSTTFREFLEDKMNQEEKTVSKMTMIQELILMEPLDFFGI